MLKENIKLIKFLADPAILSVFISWLLFEIIASSV